MTRRQLFVRTLAAYAGARTDAPARNQRRPPNVLLIMSDQHKRSCLGAAGDRVARTPHLDAFARTAVRFDQAYCSNPVCTPSRASLLTGLYTHHHESWNNTTPLPPQHKTLAHHFGRAGYLTGLVGKMHFVDAQTHGFDYKPNSGSGLPQVDDLWRDFGDPWQGTRELDEQEGPVAVGRVSQIPERDHFESFVSRESVRFLCRFRSADQPFFLICSFLKPHDSFMPAARFADLFRPEEMRLPETWGKVDLSRVPDEIRRSIEKNAPTPELRHAEEACKRIAYYYANLAQMDDCAGIVLRALHDLGLEENTIVLYTSDHGKCWENTDYGRSSNFMKALAGFLCSSGFQEFPAPVSARFRSARYRCCRH